MDLADGNATAKSDVTGKLKSKTGASETWWTSIVSYVWFRRWVNQGLIKDNEQQQSGGWGSLFG